MRKVYILRVKGKIIDYIAGVYTSLNKANDARIYRKALDNGKDNKYEIEIHVLQ